MSALAEALVAAQRRALSAMEKQYVAGKLGGEEARALLTEIGLTDDVDGDRLIAALDVIREFGAPLPSEPRGNGATDDKATDAQLALIARLVKEKGIPENHTPGLPDHEGAGARDHRHAQSRNLRRREMGGSVLVLAVVHRAEVTEHHVPVRARTGRVKRYVKRYSVECSCGQPLGMMLDYIDARRVWRAHRQDA